MTSRTGRCLCGNVRYEFGGSILWAAHCHCKSCRRNTSSPVTTLFAVEKKRCKFLGDETGAYHSSPGVVRRFCKNCGTPVSYEWSERPDHIHLYAAGLDDSSGLSVERHDFWNERVPWLSIHDDLPKHEE